MLALAAGTLQPGAAPATAEAAPVPGTTTLTNDAWTFTSRQQPTISNWNGGWSLPVGLDESTGEVNRSFVRLDLDRFTGTGADITRASLRLNRAEACRGRESGFEFWLTSKINARTTWDSEPAWTESLGSYPGSWSCPPPGYDGHDSFHFDVTAPCVRRSPVATAGCRSACAVATRATRSAASACPPTSTWRSPTRPRRPRSRRPSRVPSR
ncbi:hypothetical protein ACFQ0B_19530 [Nonomuraea thailandensis]